MVGFFEDFPEQDPANWIDGRFDPDARKRLSQAYSAGQYLHAQTYQVTSNTYEQQARTWRFEKKYGELKKSNALVCVSECPQCKLETLHLYRLSDTDYLCECKSCGVYGSGESEQQALSAQENRLLAEVQECPGCDDVSLNIYKLGEAEYVGECWHCGVSGKGNSISQVIVEIFSFTNDGGIRLD